MNNFEQVTTRYRKGEIVIQEVPAAFAGEVFDKLDEMREAGVKERIVNETFVALWCAESVVSDSTDEELTTTLCRIRELMDIKEADDGKMCDKDSEELDGLRVKIQEFKENIRKIKPKRWFDTVWPEVDKLNLITKSVQDDAEKNSEEVEPINSTSTDSAENLDIQA